MDARWKPVAVDELRVGQYLRIGHRWFDHPFVLGTFRISSASEIAIIRAAQLTRLFIDPQRSSTENAVGSATDPAASTGINELEAATDIAAYNARLQSEKAAHAESVRRQRRLLDQVQQNYHNAVDDCADVQRLFGSGDVDATQRATALVNRVLQAGEDCDCSLSFAAADQPADLSQRLSRQSLDAVAIAGVVGRRMNLPKADMSILALSALAHGVGIERLPENLRDESIITDHGDMLEYQHYPILSARILRGCDDMPEQVEQIVAKHRERLDGNGFPEGLDGDLQPLARLVGVIREFLTLTRGAKALVPAAALAHIYRNLRTAYGSDVVDPLVAALTVYPPGSYLELTDGSIGRVIRVSESERMRPTVWLFDDTVTPAEADIVDLAAIRSIRVQRVLDPQKLVSDVVEFFGGNRWAGLTLSNPSTPV
ncbi:MAG: HD domain-containing phosphohydrolase [Pseudomonadota bacterium]